MTRHARTLIVTILVVILAAYAGWFWRADLAAMADRIASVGAAPRPVAPPPQASSTASAFVSPDPAGTGAPGMNGSGGTASAAPYYGDASTTASVFTRIATTAVPGFQAEEYLVYDVTNGVTIAAQHAHARWPTASLTKLMTATVVLDHFAMDTRITITPQMAAVDPSQRVLAVNGTYTVEDLLHAMLMPSNNVAAEAVAEYYGYGAFMQEMNARAAAWGMTDTHFDNPSGLSSANESDAHDLAILATHIYQDYPTILSISDTPAYTITDLATGAQTTIRSINQFAGQPGFIGGKTGYIPESENNLLSLFRVNGKPVLIVVLGVNDLSQWFPDTTKLLDWFTMNYK